MNESEIDMDELESRLYGQVYHVSAANEDLATSCNIINDTSTKHIPRYFEDPSSRSQNKVYQIPPPFYDTMGFYPFSPVNNIVVLPPPQPQIFARPQHDSQKWLEKLLKKYEKTREKQKRKRVRRKLKRKEKQNQQKDDVEETPKTIEETPKIIEEIPKIIEEAPKTIEETPKTIEDEVNDDSVLIIEDDSDTNTSVNDVILVEIPTEIISVDCEDMQSVESDSQEDVTQNTDNLEAASCNSSTVDYTENFRGNKQFGDFNARASTSFADLNLDSFTNYIECNGKTSDGIPTLSSMLLEDNSKKQKEVVENSSDSSSESELEDYGDDLEDVSDISISLYNQVDMTPTKAKDDDVISIDCDDDLSTSTKVKLVETESLSEISGASTPKKESDIIFIDDDSVSSAEMCLQESDLININSQKILNVEGGSSATYSGTSQKPTKFKDYWTEDMGRFYRESWGHEEFSVIEEQRKMSDDPDMWKIISRDKINLNCLDREVRCRRCREFGHIAVKCTKRLDPPKCILCAHSGHRESRCPYKLCTSCGRESSYFTTYCSACSVTRGVTCTICSMKGHHFYKCPDLWRRYLFTTTDGPLVIQPLAASVKQVSDQWCSGCGANGHLEHTCKYYNRSHLPSSVLIHDYTDVYNGQVLPRPSLQPSKPQPSPKSQKKKCPLQPSKPQPSPKSPKSKCPSKPNELFKCTINLTPVNKKRLNSSTFVETVVKTLKVEVTFSDQKCEITGSEGDVRRTDEIFRRFCRSAGLYKHMNVSFTFISNPCVRKCLQKNFQYLQNPYVNWQMVAKNIYQSGKSRINYQQLNSIINAKLQLGTARDHMKILKQCLKTKSEINKESFLYIFNNSNPIVQNYNNLINKLPCKTKKIKRIEIERLKNEARRSLNQSDYRTINILHSHVIINNYSGSDVSKFMNETQRLLSKVPTPKSKQRKEKR